MPIRAWIHWIGGSQKQPDHEIVNLLAGKGIDLCGFDPYASKGHGVIFFGEASPEIYGQIHDLNRNRHLHILACCSEAISSEAVWQLMQSGASDVLICSECCELADEIITRLQRWEMVDRLVNSSAVQDRMVGSSQSLKSVLSQVVEVAHFTDASVLILGESGTGKELLANLIHLLDTRSNKGQFVILDCSTIIPELSGSEFFGHERGAFTGAVSARDGAFALADGGTLFLDEVGELPYAMQTQLLRVIQEKTFKRVGGNSWQRASFRLVCATNKDLEAQVQRGEFRADLFYRIASYVCQLPPLRERPEDILPLSYHFLQDLSPDKKTPALDAPVQEYLLRRDYPGNVRDLKQVVARMLCRYPGQGSITVGCIPPGDRPRRTENLQEWRDAGFERALRVALNRGIGLKAISRSTEETAIRIAIDESGGNLQRASMRLGVTDRALQMRRAAQRQEN